MYVVGHLQKSMETLRRGVFNSHDGYVGRNVEGMTIRQRSLGKSLETLRRGVSDRHTGYAGRTVEGMTVRRRCLLKDT